MRNNWWQRLAFSLGVMAVVSFGNGFARADDEPKGIRDLVVRIGEPGNELTGNRYRIGVKCAPAGETLHAQLLDLPKDQGLVVEQVVSDSPAAKAGIKTHDVLLSVGDKSLAQVADLTNAIEAAKGNELTIKLLRGGKTTTVTVKPEELKPLGSPVQIPLGADRQALENWVNKYEVIAEPGADPLHPRLTYRAAELGKTHELPADLSVNIYREGKNPAKITVKKGDQRWELQGESELGKLPEEIRREVEPLLAGGAMRIDLKDLTIPVPLSGPALGDVLIRQPANLEGRLEKRLDEMSNRLDEMRKTIDQLRERRHEAGGEKKSDSPRQ